MRDAWQREDTEAVVCCVCHREGRPIFDLDPFGVVRCSRCSLVFVSPRLNALARQELYEDVRYFQGEPGVYGSSALRRLAAARVRRRWTAGRLGLATAECHRPPEQARLLEVGCAYGHFLAAARGRGFNVRGLECSKIAAERAREDHGLDVESGDLTSASLHGRFDVVCAWDTIGHTPDPVACWAAVRDVLTDDGVVLFSTPSFTSLPARLLKARWPTLKPAEHIWQFTPRTHRSVAEAAGMRIERIIRSPLRQANFGRLDSLVGVARRAA